MALEILPKMSRVEGNLRNESQKQQPPRVCPDVARMAKTLRDQKTIQGKRQPPDAAEYADGRKESQPRMVDEHTKKRRQTQNKRRQSAIPPLRMRGMTDRISRILPALLPERGASRKKGYNKNIIQQPRICVNVRIYSRIKTKNSVFYVRKAANYIAKTNI